MFFFRLLFDSKYNEEFVSHQRAQKLHEWKKTLRYDSVCSSQQHMTKSWFNWGTWRQFFVNTWKGFRFRVVVRGNDSDRRTQQELSLECRVNTLILTRNLNYKSVTSLQYVIRSCRFPDHPFYPFHEEFWRHLFSILLKHFYHHLLVLLQWWYDLALDLCLLIPHACLQTQPEMGTRFELRRFFLCHGASLMHECHLTCSWQFLNNKT